MINYIIIDNDFNARNIYKEVIKTIMFNKNIDYTIEEYNKTQNNINKILTYDHHYKIYLIDINSYSEYYGISIAKKIREKDNLSEIIFIGSKDIIFEPIFNSVRKIYCILEKIQGLKEKLKNELNFIVNHYINQNEFFSLDSKGNMQINTNDILYIYRETSERKTYIVTNYQKYPINLSLKDTLPKCNNNFKQIHRACIVNQNKVSLYNWNKNYFILDNGNQINMCSKKYKNNVE